METVLWIIVLYFVFVKKAAPASSGGGTASGPAQEAALYGAFISEEDLMRYNSASTTVDGSWGDNLGFDINNAFNNGNTSTQENNIVRYAYDPVISRGLWRPQRAVSSKYAVWQ